MSRAPHNSENDTPKNNTHKTLSYNNLSARLRATPKLWTVFANAQWVRVFEHREKGLHLIKEFRPDEFFYNDLLFTCEPIVPVEKAALWLDECVWNYKFDHMILMASTEILHEFNRNLSSSVLARTIARMDGPASPHLRAALTPRT